jgi:hypothetical protein
MSGFRDGVPMVQALNGAMHKISSQGLGDGGRPALIEGRKQFFFAKKNQKTLLH